MDIHGIIARIDARIAKLGRTAREVSLAAGLSADGIRNWKRRADAPDSSTGMNMSSLSLVANELGVTLQWLLSGEEVTLSGFADDAAPFVFSPGSDTDPVRALFGLTARNPAVTHRAQASMPGFAIFPGDLLVCELSRPPEVGEIVVATLVDEQLSSSTSIVRRYLPPYLVAGDGASPAFIKIDSATVTVRFPVIGTIRGTNSI